VKIGIYNRYWRTRGGGERYAGVIAEVLSRGHAVDLLGTDPVDRVELGDHLGLDLSRTRFVLLPAVGEGELVPWTAAYDLFINCTYLSRLPSAARRSVYLVLFPQSAWPPGLVRAARGAIELIAPSRPPAVVPLHGFHGRDRRGSLWSEGRFGLALYPRAFEAGAARLRFAPTGPWSLGEALLEVRAPGLDWCVRGQELMLEPVAEGGGPSGEPREVEIACRTFVPAAEGGSPDPRHLGLCLVEADGVRPLAVVRRLARRAAGLIDGHDPRIPGSYDLLLAISEFTRRWVRRRWDLDSEILAPPVDMDRFTAPDPADKKKVVLSVGRFFHGSHNKKHVEMLRVFRDMHDRGQIPAGWEYHLVGNVHRRSQDVAYFAEVERLAAGYPVKLRVDLGLDELVEEYRRASIFWHAAGWGENERRAPEKLEHFGLTTCEAMSAGCVPVVIAKAGQLEIVEDGESGFLFTDGRQLAAATRRLIEGHGQPWIHELGRRARAAVERYSRERFEERLLAILDEHGLLDPPEVPTGAASKPLVHPPGSRP
jgi:glycosyltransferase involved in cell wall biosynthesis